MTTLNLEAKQYESKVLRDFVRARGAESRINNVALVKSSDNEGVRELFAPIGSTSGYPVTDVSAMRVSTVYACLAKLGGAISQLPIEHYRMNGVDERRQLPRGDLWYLLNETPSAAWTAASWKEWIIKCVALRGDQHTEIVRSKAASSYGNIIGFKVHHPDAVYARRLGDRLVYDIADITTGKTYTIDQDDMLHFTGFGFDGLRSLSMIQYAARNAISNSLAASDYAGKSIGEGAMPQIAIGYANKMSEDAQRILRNSFVETYSGTSSRKLPLVLTEGAQVHELSISPVDMQLLESRRFEREDICQAMGVPPVLIGENEKTSSWGTGIEQITLGFVKFTVKPHLVRWTEELNRKLFRNAGPFVEFDLDALLRGDSKAQSEAFRAALGGPGSGDGWMTVNEVRRLKNLPPDNSPESSKLFKASASNNQNTKVPA